MVRTAANPYHYANNDPLGWLDPLGLRSMTDADLAAYRQAHGQGYLEKAADWVGDNWEYIAAGAMIVGGVALMFTGVGGPAGLALMAGSGALISGGISIASQKKEGHVDWGRVGINMVIGAGAGALGGAAGAYAGGVKLLANTSPWLRGAVAGGAENVVGGAAERAAYGENPFDPVGIAQDTLLGGGIGAGAGRLFARFNDTPSSPQSDGDTPTSPRPDLDGDTPTNVRPDTPASARGEVDGPASPSPTLMRPPVPSPIPTCPTSTPTPTSTQRRWTLEVTRMTRTSGLSSGRGPLIRRPGAL